MTQQDDSANDRDSGPCRGDDPAAATEDGAYAPWSAAIDEIAEQGGTTLLVGATDTGKTTFARLLLNRITYEGERAAILDADLGQSEIGPPACVGLAFAEAPIRALADLPVSLLAFVGITSAPTHLPEYLVGVRRLADAAEARSLVVDTGGYINGPGARRLHQTQFDLLAPARVVALQRSGESEALLRSMRRRDGCRVHSLTVPDVIGMKPPRFRTQRRAMRFAAYFRDARMHTFPFDDVALVGTWLGSGTPLPAHLLKFLLRTLEPASRVYYAEMCDRHLGLMVDRAMPTGSPEVGIAQKELHARSISMTVAPRMKHLLVGLEAGNGRLLGMGLLGAMDFRRRTLGVLTPVRTPDAARILRLGALRVQPDGTEIGTVDPSEI